MTVLESLSQNDFQVCAEVLDYKYNFSSEVLLRLPCLKVSEKLGEVRGEMLIAYFKILFLNLPGVTEENVENLAHNS